MEKELVEKLNDELGEQMDKVQSSAKRLAVSAAVVGGCALAGIFGDCEDMYNVYNCALVAEAGAGVYGLSQFVRGSIAHYKGGKLVARLEQGK